jgi:hypothetical protein
MIEIRYVSGGIQGKQETSKRLMINNSQTIQAPKAYFPEDPEIMSMNDG